MSTGFLVMLKRNKKEIVFFLLFVIASLPFILKLPSNDRVILKDHELFDKKLNAIRCVDDLVNYSDNLTNSSKFDTIQFVESLSRITKLRFKHGLANYSLSDNWIASFAGKLFWDHFAAIVDADDILKHKEGLCSQQTIVFLQALKQKGIQARSVGLGKKEGPGHFIAEVKYMGNWHTYDVSLEPDWSKVNVPHQSMDYYRANRDSLFKVYKSHMPIELFNALMKTVDYGEIGKFPAKRMKLFHRTTYFIIIILPYLFLILFVNALYKRQRSKKNNF
ncbi:MAG: hypothetical protein SGJ15_04520 [Bacteroidota bacterium]|nr:hypothetical protein [Bacteroidota bacterium]